jgi:hypothetical protein
MLDDLSPPAHLDADNSRLHGIKQGKFFLKNERLQV